ncbi:hypothetical protein VTN77DRAFT_8081 [Rasamsonia byssochlamydoides]|uniref:uncharacterized protein n=1 Tax=Rasamsonia byssochlamydoides TaxID=89139 RepID=UPI003744A3AC
MSATAIAATAVLDVAAAAATNNRTTGEHRWEDQARGQRDLYTQFVISTTLGLSAFLAFCILRPKWTELYAARRKRRNAASALPELPDSFFGWIPVLYRITDEEVLASAGLDAYVFLSFFKFALKFLSATFIFAVAIILPLHLRYAGQSGIPGWDQNDGQNDDDDTELFGRVFLYGAANKKLKSDPKYLWIYVIFPYVFTGLAVYLLIQETNKIIWTRQKYLGSQTSTTDRTIRLSGIPPELRSEEKIKEFIEGLQIGKVDSITLCRNWQELDILMEERMKILRNLERAWTKHLGYKKRKRDSNTLPLTRSRQRTASVASDTATERSQLLENEDGRPQVSSNVHARPKTRIWYGPFKLLFRSVDAIDYYEEKLRRLDEKIMAARQKEYPPTALAFVTMESISACQMVVQAILDPHPMQLVATLAPAPADVVWKNTYLSRPRRMMQSWFITAVIGFLTVFWSVLLIPLAYLLELETLHKVVPSLADALSRHPLAKSLVQTGLPTLVLSLMTVAVPYMYSWLSRLQGMTSRGDVELSVISKNFFFTFFNLFLVFTVFGSATTFYGFWQHLRDAFKDATTIALALATSLESFSQFYTNWIILQGLGLFPFRLLEFGSVAMYPIHFLSAKTPREYAELSTPPTFSYGFSIPQTILIFIICVVYSVFPSSWLICLCGLVYFFLGQFIYKYQLLYAMDHQQHSTGRAWPMICSRVFVGLVVFQLAMIGVLALRRAITRSLLLVPLLGATVWFTYFFARTYEPLMKFIALRSIDKDRPDELDRSLSPPMALSPPSGLDRDSLPVRIGGRDIGLRLKKYVNPNLILPLDGPWIPGSDRSMTISSERFEEGPDGSV